MANSDFVEYFAEHPNGIEIEKFLLHLLIKTEKVDKRYITKFTKMFRTINISGSGKISPNEIENFTQDFRVTLVRCSNDSLNLMKNKRINFIMHQLDERNRFT